MASPPNKPKQGSTCITMTHCVPTFAAPLATVSSHSDEDDDSFSEMSIATADAKPSGEGRKPVSSFDLPSATPMATSPMSVHTQHALTPQAAQTTALRKLKEVGRGNFNLDQPDLQALVSIPYDKVGGMGRRHVG